MYIVCMYKPVSTWDRPVIMLRASLTDAPSHHPYEEGIDIIFAHKKRK